MATYIARRLILLPLVGFGVTILIFALLSFLDPGIRAGAFITNPNQLKALDAIIRKYGLDQPMYVQYWTWLREVLHGNLGWSQTARLPVGEAIVLFFPTTLELTISAFVPIMVIGIWLGTAAAVHRDKMLDHLSRIFSISFRSMPSFAWGLVILMIFYGRLNWFPPGRLSLEADLFVRSGQFHAYTGFMTLDALLNGQLWILFDAVRHLVGPALTLTMVSIALLVRVTRSSMLEALGQDYVRTARAKGLANSVVTNKHARKNALIPVITLSSLTIVSLLGGVVITETIFNFPGIGRWGAFAAQQLDIPGVTGFAMFIAALTVFGNLAADVLYAYFDPRIRLR